MSLPRTMPTTSSRTRSSSSRNTNSTSNTTNPSQNRKKGLRVVFHLSILSAWLAITFVWLLTPLSYFYVLYTLITLSPSLTHIRPATSHLSFKILHYLTLSYCALEIPFSILYRFLAVRCDRRKKGKQYSRKYLRNVFRNALEHGLESDKGLDVEQVIDDELEGEMPGHRRPRPTSGGLPGGARSMRNRTRVEAEGKDGSKTPDIELNSLKFTNHDESCLKEGNESHSTRQASIPIPEMGKHEPTATTVVDSTRGIEDEDDDEGYGASIRSEGRSIRPRSASYTPSFMERIEPHDPRAKDFRDWITLWFNGVDYNEIKRLNMADWLAWSLYSSTLEELERERSEWEAAGRPPLHLEGEPDCDQDGLELEQDKLGLVEHCLDLIEFRAGVLFKQGRNPKVKVIRLTLDPVRVTSRPLLLYLLVGVLQKRVVLNMKLRGFKEVKDGDMRYLIRIPQGWKPVQDCPESSRPLLFIHGLGMGAAQYASLLSYLSKAKELSERPIIVLVQPHISMSIFSRNYLNPPSQATLSAGIGRMAKKWDLEISGMTILSHSNGSIVHGWICKDLPDLITRSCFVDPVCFQLWEPWVCYNFLYAQPRKAFDYIMRYFVGRELGVAFMLQRSFDWSSNLLFPTDIPRVTSPYHTSFYLAGKDSILNADRVRRYLKRFGIREVKKGENVGPARGGLKVHHSMKHGESMVGSGLAFEQILSWVTAECANGADSATCDSSA